MLSDPVSLGQAAADGNGAVSFTWNTAAPAEAGSHRAVMDGPFSGAAEAGFTVSGATPAPTPDNPGAEAPSPKAPARPPAQPPAPADPPIKDSLPHTGAGADPDVTLPMVAAALAAGLWPFRACRLRHDAEERQSGTATSWRAARSRPARRSMAFATGRRAIWF
jgi:hypothetical protein